MARSFNGSSNGLRTNYSASAQITNWPVTIAAWVRMTSAPTARKLVVGIRDATGGTNNGIGIQIRGESEPPIPPSGSWDQPIAYIVSAGSTLVQALYTTPSDGTWHLIVARFTSSTVEVMLDGATQIGSEVHSRSFPTVHEWMVGARILGSGTVDQYFGGDIGTVAVWTLALTDAEIESLAAGANPLNTHPAALVDFWPLVNDVANRLDRNHDLGGGSSTHAATHPPINQLAGFQLGPLPDTFIGTGAGDFVLATASAAGAVTIEGTGAGTFALASGTGAGTETIAGSGAATFALATAAGTGSGYPETTPDQIPNISAWWDADAAATLTLSVGDVTTWEDRAGAADFTQITGKPKPSTTALDGRTWLDVSAGEILHVASATQTEVNFGSGELTIAIALRTTATAHGVPLNKGSSDRYRIGTNLTTPGDIYGILDDGPTSLNINAGAGVNDGATHFLVLQRDNTANEMRVYLDGAQITGSPQALSGFGNIDDASFELLLAAVPSGASYANFFAGQIGEVVFYKRALSSTELGDLLAYLAYKWAPTTGTGAGTLPLATGAAAGTETMAGAGAGTLPLPTGTGAGAETVAGTGAGTFALATGTGAGTETITGTAAGTLPPLAGSGAGSTGSSGITGAGAGTLPLPQAAAAGEELVQGAATGSLPLLTGTGAGEPNQVRGAGSGALRPLDGAGSGSVLITGAAAGTFPVPTGVGTGWPVVEGAAAGTFALAAGAGTGGQTFPGTGAGTFPVPTGTGAGAEGFRLAGAATFPLATGAGTGGQTFAGAGAAKFPLAAGAGAGAQSFGAGTANLPLPTAAGTGALVGAGAGAGTFPALTAAAAAELVFVGVGSGSFPLVVGDGNGAVVVAGSGAGILPLPQSAGAGVVPAAGTAAGTFPLPVGAGAGESNEQIAPVAASLAAATPRTALAAAAERANLIAAEARQAVTVPAARAPLAAPSTKVSLANEE